MGKINSFFKRLINEKWEYVGLLGSMAFNGVFFFAKNREFSFNGEKYRYFYNKYNHTWMNERSIEIPIIIREIKKENIKDEEILEIGNVLNHYYPFEHAIVDKYEKAKGVVNQDVVDFNLKKKYNLILSISTIEHVGWDEKLQDPKKIPLSIKNLKKHLKKGGKIILTVPMGHNPYLDNLIEENKLFEKRYFMKRGFMNRWKETSFEEVKGIKYHFDRSNAIVILIIEN